MRIITREGSNEGGVLNSRAEPLRASHTVSTQTLHYTALKRSCAERGH